MSKKVLKIDDAITVSNADRIKNQAQKIKDKKHLASLICESLNSNKDNVYMRLYRAEKDGFFGDNNDLINAICKELNVDESILVSYT